MQKNDIENQNNMKEYYKPLKPESKPIPNDLSLLNDKTIVVSKAEFEYMQNGDSNNPNEEQFLTIRKLDAGAGMYFIIETKRWAFDNIDELINVLTDFQKRFLFNLFLIKKGL